MAFTQPIHINIGSYANDGTGVDLRTAFDYVNQNFNHIYSSVVITGASNLGTGEDVFASQSGATLSFKSIAAGAGLSVASDGTTITLTNTKVLQDDTAPTLGSNLNLNGHNILGTGSNGYTGDVQSTVWGLDVRDIKMQLDTLTGDFDLGTFAAPYTGGIDLGVF
jgi:hypothetical protein